MSELEAAKDEEYDKALTLMAQESDRGRLLVACSFIDDVLRRTLLAFFIKGSTARQLVDEHGGPLSSYAARAHAAYALGLISKAEMQDVIALGDLRNIFAHQTDAAYDQPEIRAFAPRLARAAGLTTGESAAPERVVHDACVRLMARLFDRPARIRRVAPVRPSLRRTDSTNRRRSTHG